MARRAASQTTSKAATTGRSASTGKSAAKTPARKSASRTTAKKKAAPSKGSGTRRGGPRKNSSTAASNRSRPIWSGQLRLALVTVPVQLYSALQSGGRIAFHQVHAPTGKRVRYEKVVPGVGPVEKDDIVKGYELPDGNYVLLEPEEIDAVKIEASRILDLVQFVDYAEVDPIYFDRPYYVAPDGELAEEAYGVLREALRRARKMAIGQFVMRGQEHVAALKPCGNGLLLETLRYPDEVREAAPLFADVGDEKPDPELLDLATELIKRKSKPFDPTMFEDRYSEALHAMIEAKVEKRAVVDVSEEEQPSGGAKVIDLVEALKQSVRRSEGSAKTDAGEKQQPRKPGRRTG